MYRREIMQPPPPQHHHPRINLAELKALMVKKLGPEGSKQYFFFLNMFLSLKVTKVEFNKICFKIIGRENIPLHNQLIRSILRKACGTKVPASKDDVLNRDMQNGSHNDTTLTSTRVLNGGDMLVLPVSPQKTRIDLRDWRDNSSRSSALGPNGTAGFSPHVLENRDSHQLEIAKPAQHHRGLILQSENENETVVVRDDKKEAARSPLQAPLGVHFIGQANSLTSSGRSLGNLNDVALLDTLTIKERVEQIAIVHGLEGASVDSTNILNRGLDCYLKRLIESCIDLVESRSENKFKKSNIIKPLNNIKLINGFRHHRMQNNTRESLEVPEEKTRCPILSQDFRVSMELNPLKLGNDWSLLLERICTHTFEE